MVESVRDYAIFMLDPDGRVATWNRGAERIKGWRAEEIIGRHFSAFYPAEDVRSGKCERELEIAARDGRVEDEGWRVRKDGTRFWANVLITAVRQDDGELIGFAKVTRDLTERRRVEEERAARLAAEHANRAKDEFLAMLGHELRNPLAPIVTALQLMKLRSDQPMPKEHQVIERQVRHMMRLVDDLLDVSRITRGTIALKRQRLDLRDAMAKAIEIASPLLEQRGHHFDVDVPRQAIVIDADEARLTQVFANLLVNAAKYTEAGGHISVAVKTLPGEVVVEVRDDGAGISADLLPQIFDLFVQGRQSAARSQGGLGIGLTLVRTLVELHGGSVGARSDGAGRGATFTVRLPLAATPIAGQSRADANALLKQATARLRVLVVDDNEDARTLLVELLSSTGYEVQAAPDAVAALEVVRTFAPNVAVLDIGLPVMDGYTLAERMREELGPATPHLLALTGYGSEHDRERSRALGFAAHLVKPIDANQLLDVIARLPRDRPGQRTVN